jgi:hypothetical protein
LNDGVSTGDDSLDSWRMTKCGTKLNVHPVATHRAWRPLGVRLVAADSGGAAQGKHPDQRRGTSWSKNDRSADVREYK